MCGQKKCGNDSFDKIKVDSLKVKKINGKKTKCIDKSIILTSNVIPYEEENPIPPPKPESFNSTVWEGLWNNAVTTLDNVLISNLACGRFRNKLINSFYCPTSCLPLDYTGCSGVGYFNASGSITGNILTILGGFFGDADNFSVIGLGVQQNTRIVQRLTNSTFEVNIPQNVAFTNLLLIADCPTTSCPPVPMEIYGQYSVSPKENEKCCEKIVNMLAYKLDIINQSINLSNRAVAVLVQIGWIDPTNSSLKIEQIDLAIKQFNPSLFNEQMNANILLPTELILKVKDNQAVVQLVVYIEDGISVSVPKSPYDKNVSVSFTSSY